MTAPRAQRWPRTRLTIQVIDYRGVVQSSREVWGEVEVREADTDLEDTGQRGFIARPVVQARAHTRGDSAQEGERLVDTRGRRWTVTGVVGGDTPWASGETLLLEEDVAGGATG